MTNKTNLSFLDEIKETTKAYKLENVIPIRNMPVNVPYKIKDIQRVPSKYYGERLVVILSQVGEFKEEYIITAFLPNRFQRLTDKQIDKMLKHDPPLQMIYKGKDENGIHDIDFSPI